MMVLSRINRLQIFAQIQVFIRWSLFNKKSFEKIIRQNYDLNFVYKLTDFYFSLIQHELIEDCEDHFNILKYQTQGYLFSRKILTEIDIMHNIMLSLNVVSDLLMFKTKCSTLIPRVWFISHGCIYFCT